jgi:hypothetical protein
VIGLVLAATDRAEHASIHCGTHVPRRVQIPLTVQGADACRSVVETHGTEQVT